MPARASKLLIGTYGPSTARPLVNNGFILRNIVGNQISIADVEIRGAHVTDAILTTPDIPHGIYYEGGSKGDLTVHNCSTHNVDIGVFPTNGQISVALSNCYIYDNQDYPMIFGARRSSPSSIAIWKPMRPRPRRPAIRPRSIIRCIRGCERGRGARP